MKNYTFSYRWQFNCTSSPQLLWPFLSDTNRFFKDMEQHPVHQAPLSHDKKNGHYELTYEHLHRLDIWEEEPYQWEAPFRYHVRRSYKRGYYKHLMFSTELSERKNGTIVTVSFSGEVKGFTGWLFVKRKFGSHFRRKLGRIITSYDTAASQRTFPVRNTPKLFESGKRWVSLQNKLVKASKDPVISSLLIQTLQHADELDLSCIHPPRLARLWKKPLHEVIDVLFHAAKIDILNFSWNIVCPSCRRTLQNNRKLKNVTGPLFCRDCEQDVEPDLNHTVQMVFHVHPLVRKFIPKQYCAGSPQLRPHVFMNQRLKPEQTKYVKLKLPEGVYRITSDKTDVTIIAEVSDTGLENATLSFHSDEPDNQQVEFSPEPRLILRNLTNEPMQIVCEDTGWEEYALAASRVTSMQLFRDLFPREYLREGKQMAAKNLTILFTDLFNSSKMYTNNGDEKAIGRVMDHFEALNQIILEESGAIVKTIGDAVMAIFPKPAYAVRAFERADLLFKKADDEDPFRLKGGIHSGDCVAVTLNNGIDYFGNTVNIASRLVEYAKGGELVISGRAYNNRGMKELLHDKRDNCSIHHFDVSLKGFDNQAFEAKRISLRHSSLRLVV